MMDPPENRPPPCAVKEKTHLPNHQNKVKSKSPRAKTAAPFIFTIPPKLNGYLSRKPSATFHLGPSAEKYLFAVTHEKLVSTRLILALHAGPDEKSDPVVARLESEKFGNNWSFTVTILPTESHPQKMVETVDCPGTGATRSEYTFCFPVEAAPGKFNTARESFTWHRSSGPEIQDIARRSFGWKLVHSSPPSESSGQETVAVLAHNNKCSMTKKLKFEFRGSGLAGTFGSSWVFMALLSGLCLWSRDLQHPGSASRAARDRSS